MKSDSKNRRKVLLINPKFQITFLIFTVGMSALAIAIFYGANFYFFYKFQKIGVSVGLSPDHIFFRFIQEQKHVMDAVFAVTSLVVLVALTVGGLILSHWVSGPLHRLRNHMLGIAAGGGIREIKFRKRDFFPELAHAFNQLRSRIR